MCLCYSSLVHPRALLMSGMLAHRYRLHMHGMHPPAQASICPAHTCRAGQFICWCQLWSAVATHSPLTFTFSDHAVTMQSSPNMHQQLWYTQLCRNTNRQTEGPHRQEGKQPSVLRRLLSVCLSVCLSVRLSICLSVCPYVCGNMHTPALSCYCRS